MRKAGGRVRQSRSLCVATVDHFRNWPISEVATTPFEVSLVEHSRPNLLARAGGRGEDRQRRETASLPGGSSWRPFPTWRERRAQCFGSGSGHDISQSACPHITAAV